MYLYAFAEAWAFVFPEHFSGLVAIADFVGCVGLAAFSSGLALRAQGVLLFVVALALLSAAGGLWTAPALHEPVLFGQGGKGPGGASFLQAFAIFFPAFTGIMVGAGMSGGLADPRRSIPRGTLVAWGVSGLLYVGFAGWYAVIAPPEDLLGNPRVMTSFRPAFSVPRFVPALGVVVCLAGLSLSSPFGGVAEILFVVGIYAVLSRVQVEPPGRPCGRASRSPWPRGARAAPPTSSGPSARGSPICWCPWPGPRHRE